MDLVKKNVLSIACGVIAIAAIVAWFWPVGPMFTSLQADLDARAAEYKKVDDLRTAPRSLPSLVLEGGEKPVLNRFPNEKVVAVGREKTKALTEQSDRMTKTVAERNIRQPLVPGSLPIASPSARSAFGPRYMAALGLVEAAPGAGLPNFNEGLPKQLAATRPPYPEEMMEMANKIWDDEFSKRVIQIGADSNLETVTQDFYERVRTLPQDERNKRANAHRIYLDETSLPASQEILSLAGRNPRDTQIWYAQTAYWITEDVVNGINAANKGSTKVQDSPVKHLVRLNIPFGIPQYVLPTATPAAGGEAGVVPTDANGVPQLFAMSPTGRVSNDVYDVLHFELVLRVDFRKIPHIVAELEHNRLFTVLSTGITSVDAQAELKESGYVYGNAPIAEVTLQCEALFLRSWTVAKESNYKTALMPQEVRGLVGAEVVAGTTPGSTGGEVAPEEQVY